MTSIVDTPGGSPPGSLVVEAAEPEIPPERQKFREFPPD